MDRVIKFRGKRVDNGEWVYGDLIHWKGKGGIGLAIVDCYQFTIKSSNEVIPSSVGQFTGFTDCEGKEEYEHDITEDGYVIRFINGGWCCQSRFDENRVYALDTYNAKRKRIIGNIHDKEEVK